MNVLVDVGNSRLKWCSDIATGLTGTVALDYREHNACDALTKAWSAMARPDCVGIASVSTPEIRAWLINVVHQVWPEVPIRLAETPREACGVINGYSHPQTLGVDRWLAMLAAFDAYPAPLCVVDCGTAMTVDMIDAEGFHQGGLIAPGLNAMQTALSVSTAQLNDAGAAMQAGTHLARNTAAGIANGAMMAAVGFIEALHARLDARCSLIMTGGDAVVIAANLKIAAIIDPQLVMKGLAMLCRGGKAP
ncbi:MAG: type III pantothenate kinase [Methylomonas sp.]|nr:type III pantothenate kinase [Methylomonas sp.]PPD22058.1 MAG: type III pantothenate kinase [Methylomonas sp.]PPD25250.1 MAG: type III pantothenate kinase [Methylomonas sp.]PPD35201.1 MAG: type III pantothenate kinase [Methylomonas sp.]PPD42454.1 MAG: type III pantothenate kinase [Methylomonas sp.]